MTKKLHPRLERFLNSVSAAAQGEVQDWFRSAHIASEKYKKPVLRQSFLTGAIPEVFTMDAYRVDEFKSATCYDERTRGAAWRIQNSPSLNQTWFGDFFFEKADGTFTKYRLPLDPVGLHKFITKVLARRDSFV